MRRAHLCSVLVISLGLAPLGCETATIAAIDGGGLPAKTADATLDTKPTATACVPGESAKCTGPGGCATNQICQIDGAGYGPCTCATPTSDASSNGDASSNHDAQATTPCIPGVSVACVGPGGCSTNQICASDGSGFGPCTCATPADAATTPTACVPGQSVACAGAGGCISNQICNLSGSGYGACTCASDGGTVLSCIPGQSIACGGPYGCTSFQVCNANGNGYSACDCPDAASYVNGDGGTLADGYAPLPPPLGNQGYNSVWSGGTLYLPPFSIPDCAVIPPIGEYYAVTFSGAGPNGTFPGNEYSVNVISLGSRITVGTSGDTYTLSAFDATGVASGQMGTDEGIIPLIVKNCQ